MLLARGERAAHLHVDLPVTLFPRDATVILNDLEATCYGILALDQRNELARYFAPLWGAPAAAAIELLPACYVVEAMGAGLGVGVIVRNHDADEFGVLPLENGHTQVSPSALPTSTPTKTGDTVEHLSASCTRTLLSVVWFVVHCGVVVLCLTTFAWMVCPVVLCLSVFILAVAPITLPRPLAKCVVGHLFRGKANDSSDPAAYLASAQCASQCVVAVHAVER